MAGSRRSVVRAFTETERSAYFSPADRLVAAEEYPYDVSLAYMFIRLESCQRAALLFGAMKLHSVELGLTRKSIDQLDITRGNYPEYFETIYSRKIPRALRNRLQHAETVRDDLMHGRRPSEKDKRKAIVDILEYFDGFCDLIQEVAGFDVSGDMRGFKGRAVPHDRKTTRWILKGMGLPCS